MSLLSLKHVTKSYGGLKALSDVDLEVPSGSILSLIGPNGAGKTTLFDCISGLQRPGRGSIHFRAHSVLRLKTHQIARMGMTRTFQGIRLFPEMTALENLIVGAHRTISSGVIEALLRGRKIRREEQVIASKGMRLLEFVGLADRASISARFFSYGDQRKLEIARSLASEPVLLLLDEPAAGMNPRETEALVQLIHHIRERGVTVLLIEHDMRVVMGISEKVVVLDHGVKIAEGPPEVIRRDPT